MAVDEWTIRFDTSRLFEHLVNFHADLYYALMQTEEYELSLASVKKCEIAC